MDLMEGDGRHPFMDAKSKMMAEQAISRATLGDIGNRVSAITIDTSKGGAIKKEILQPAGGVVIRNPVAIIKPPPNVSNSHPFSSLSSHPPHPHLHPEPVIKEIDTGRVKVEWMPDHHNLLQAARPAKSEDVVLEDFGHAGPMDSSIDAEDAFSKAFMDRIEDIDAEDRNNPQLVSIYVNSIYDYMRSLESPENTILNSVGANCASCPLKVHKCTFKGQDQTLVGKIDKQKKYSIHPNFLEGSELTGKMRAILIDWLCQVHSRFHLLQETLYLTVAIIDRYLQARPCTKNRLQLVGVTAMLVASKYEEAFAPEVADFVYITDNAYNSLDVREMEQDILRTLDFSFGRPHCLHFLRRNSKAGQVDATKHTLAKYLMELSMVEYDMSHIKPSLIAASALYLAMKIIDNSRWTETLWFHSGYAVTDLLSTAQRMEQLVVKAETSKQTAVKTKYSNSKFMKIASLPQLKSIGAHLDTAYRKGV